jgi:hypothetical protein
MTKITLMKIDYAGFAFHLILSRLNGAKIDVGFAMKGEVRS